MMQDFDYSFGIEEEFFVSSLHTRALVHDVPEALIERARRELGEAVTAEMLRSQIEIASPVFHHVDQAIGTMTALRRSLANIAASMDLCLIAAGTHPLGVWHEQLATREVRYERLMADFRIVGRRNLVCGLHVHVAIPPGVDRIDIMNRAMRWLPLFLALSTSSPFWNGHDTGLFSYRQALYDEWPRSGIPDFFDDEQDYQAFTGRMGRAGALQDPSQLWWAIRPALRFPTLELRIADSCTRVEDAVAIATLFRCLIAALVADRSLGARRTTHTRRIIDENRWIAKRDGLAAKFIAEASSETIPVPQVLDSLLSLLAEPIARFHCESAIDLLRGILQHGTSAHAQLRIYESSREAGSTCAQALHEVLRWLRQTTAGCEPSPAG
jgi:carboxylate-amine ligase